MKKYFRAGQATHEYMAHGRCMLGTQGYDTYTVCEMLIAFPLQQ
jgi:hypothetical protein